VNEPLLQSLVTIEKLLLETVRFLDNCPLRDERWVKRQIVDLGKELEHIQVLIQNEVLQVQTTSTTQTGLECYIDNCGNTSDNNVF
jgi:hypothetical protein